jgi:peroxiredoxin
VDPGQGLEGLDVTGVCPIDQRLLGGRGGHFITQRPGGERPYLAFVIRKNLPARDAQMSDGGSGRAIDLPQTTGDPVALLQPNDPFPAITITPPDADPVALRDALAGHFGVVLFFRGAWCPYCNAQLRAFQRAEDTLSERNISVAALSVDDEATTRELIEKHGLTFPVGHSADARAIAEVTGAFLNEEPLYVQSTGFVLSPDGQVIVSVYSSGAIGRLVPEDVSGMVRYITEHSAADS